MSPIQALAVIMIRAMTAPFIFFAIQTSSYYLNVVWSDVSPEATDYTVHYVVVSLFTVITGATLWFAAPFLARVISPRVDRDKIDIRIDADQLIMLGSFLIGGFYLLGNFPGLLVICLSAIIDALGQNSSFFPPDTDKPRFFFTLDQILPKVLTVLVALWMMFRPAQIAIFFAKVRSAGLNAETNDRDAD